MREITRNARLIIETKTRSEKLEHSLQVILYIKSNRDVIIESTPWIDVSRHPPWTDEMRERLQKIEKSMGPILAYALARLVEAILHRIAQGS